MIESHVLYIFNVELLQLLLIGFDSIVHINLHLDTYLCAYGEKYTVVM